MGQTTLKQNQVKGMGAWTTFTPSWTNLTIGSGTNTGKYYQMGKFVAFRVYVVLAADSSVGTNPQLTLPVTSATYAHQLPIGYIEIEDSGTATYFGVIRQGGYLHTIDSSGTYDKLGTITSTSPFTWTTNDNISIQGYYECA